MELFGWLVGRLVRWCSLSSLLYKNNQKKVKFKEWWCSKR